jgi:hypothetical protein
MRFIFSPITEGTTGDFFEEEKSREKDLKFTQGYTLKKGILLNFKGSAPSYRKIFVSVK